MKEAQLELAELGTHTHKKKRKKRKKIIVFLIFMRIFKNIKKSRKMKLALSPFIFPLKSNFQKNFLLFLFDWLSFF